MPGRSACFILMMVIAGCRRGDFTNRSTASDQWAHLQEPDRHLKSGRVEVERHSAWVCILVIACALLVGCEAEGRFSTEPIRINLQDSEVAFLIPRNYFGPREATEPDEKNLSQFGFRLFLPDFVGYSRETADLARYIAPTEQEVRVLETRNLSKYMFDISENRTIPAPPTAWGDVEAIFDQRKPKAPQWRRHQYGLECEGWSDAPGHKFVCKGLRSNGEMIFIAVSDADEILAGECDVIYASETEGLYLRYRYWRKHLAKWREIDDAIWDKLHTWRIK